MAYPSHGVARDRRSCEYQTAKIRELCQEFDSGVRDLRVGKKEPSKRAYLADVSKMFVFSVASGKNQRVDLSRMLGDFGQQLQICRRDFCDDHIWPGNLAQRVSLF